MFNSVSSFKNLTTHILIIACLCSQYSCDEPVLDNIFDGDITPGIEIENEGLNGSEINTSDITLDWSGNDFSFEFSYLLEPRDADWSDWDSTTTAYYDYLDEGPYVFKVKGRFDENEEQETPDSILFNVNAIDGPGLRVYPLYKAVNTAEEFTVDIFAEEVENLVGAEIHISYDPSLVSLIDAASGSFLSEAMGQSIFIEEHDEIAGAIVLTLATSLDGAEGLSGSGSLSQLTFSADAAGSFTLEIITNSQFRDGSNEPIVILSSSIENGQIVIQ